MDLVDLAIDHEIPTFICNVTFVEIYFLEVLGVECS